MPSITASILAAIPSYLLGTAYMHLIKYATLAYLWGAQYIGHQPNVHLVLGAGIGFGMIATAATHWCLSEEYTGGLKRAYRGLRLVYLGWR